MCIPLEAHMLMLPHSVPVEASICTSKVGHIEYIIVVNSGDDQGMNNCEQSLVIQEWAQLEHNRSYVKLSSPWLCLPSVPQAGVMNPEGLPGCASGLFGTMPPHPVPKMVNSCNVPGCR